MIKAYSIVEESPLHITYQYNSICGYWLYGSLAFMVIGYGLEVTPIEIVGAAFMFGYLALVYFPALQIARKIRAGMRNSTVELRGSRWSFANPLTIKALRSADDQT